ncbi:MAG: PAS domain S-box protein [Balneolaceae bacterium]
MSMQQEFIIYSEGSCREETNNKLRKLEISDIFASKLQNLSDLSVFVKEKRPSAVVCLCPRSLAVVEEVLKIVRSEDSTIPVIWVDDPVGEEVVAQMMRQGLSDFLLCEHLDALPERIHSLSLLSNETGRWLRGQSLMDSFASHTATAVWIRGRDRTFHYANQIFLELFRLQGESVLGRTVEELFGDSHLTKQFLHNDRKVLESGEPAVFEESVQTPSGERRYLTHIFPLQADGEEVTTLGGVATDITGWRHAEEKLLEAEGRLQQIVENSTNLFYAHTPDHQITYISPHSIDFLGFEPEEAMRRWTEFSTDHPVNERALKLTERAIETGERQPSYELQLKKKDGESLWVMANESPVVENGKTVMIVGSLTDITELKEHELHLEESLEENRTLMTEIHHRVKNNLAVVTALMQLQTEQTDSEEAISILTTSMGRIKAIAVIHEQLYQTRLFSRLDYSEQVQKLIQGILAAMNSSREIEVDFDLESLMFNINQALPLSLIINEVATNSLKHAFKNRESGRLTIQLSQKEAGLIRFVFEDNGVGLPSDFDAVKRSSLGLELIDTLCQQLGAKYRFESLPDGGGTRFLLEFTQADVKGSSSMIS